VKENNDPVWRFVRNLNAAFGSRMTADARQLYYDELSKWHLNDREWQQAMSIITAQEVGDRVPPLATIYDYLRQAQREIAQNTPGRAAIFWDMPDGRRYAKYYQLTMPRDDMTVEELARWLSLPAQATNIHTVVIMSEEDRKRGLDTIVDWRNHSERYPEGQPTQDEIYFKLTDAGVQEARECFRKGWIESGADPAKCDTMFDQITRAERMRREKSGFARVGEDPQPADYDDSEQALGRQRIAQLERLAEYERQQAMAEEAHKKRHEIEARRPGGPADRRERLIHGKHVAGDRVTDEWIDGF
jgi:DNA-binding PadR family transcriptional regulator